VGSVVQYPFSRTEIRKFHIADSLFAELKIRDVLFKLFPYLKFEFYYSNIIQNSFLLSTAS